MNITKILNAVKMNSIGCRKLHLQSAHIRLADKQGYCINCLGEALGSIILSWFIMTVGEKEFNFEEAENGGRYLVVYYEDEYQETADRFHQISNIEFGHILDQLRSLRILKERRAVAGENNDNDEDEYFFSVDIFKHFPTPISLGLSTIMSMEDIDEDFIEMEEIQIAEALIKVKKQKISEVEINIH